MSKRSVVCAVSAVGAALAIAAPSAIAADSTATATTGPYTTPTAPPPLTVLSGKRAVGHGEDIFVSPFGDTSQYLNGAEILSPAGKELWFHPVPAGQEDADFRTQKLHGKPVLTFWQGTGLGGVSTGADYIYNDHYKLIGTVKAGDGLSADGHEFLLTNNGEAWIISYTTGTANLTSIGGPANQAVINGVVQEINVKTGKVLFSWNSADHVPYAQSEQPLPASASTPWDWFHLNAVKLARNGNLLIDARDTWTTYEVSPHSGKILWQLGGKNSSFTLTAGPGQTLNDAGTIFAWQHDVEQVGPDAYTVFDNESAGVANTGSDALTDFNESRAGTIRLNLRTRTAELVSSNAQPEGQIASSQGNVQTLPGGGQFVGWGILPYISQFSRTGKLQFSAQWPTGVNSYRAYLQPWHGAASAYGSSTATGTGSTKGQSHAHGATPKQGRAQKHSKRA